MKRFLHVCSLLMMMCVIGKSAKALDQVDGVYHIATAEDFVEFVNVTNDADPAANALLTADIDLSELGEVSVGAILPYTGVFDGAYHTVTINRESTVEGSALFGILGGTVKNLNVAGYIKTAYKYASGLVVKTNGTEGKILNCVSTVTIESEVGGDGTHGGIAALVEGSAVIENCAFAGKFVGPTTNWGGFVGWSTGTTELKNCLMIADVAEASSDGSNTFSRNPGNCTFSNCIYLNAFGTVPGGTTQITAEMLASGEVCFMLNGKQSEDCAWFQNIGTDALPTTDPTHSVVYANGKLHCNGVAYEGESNFSNTNTGVTTDEHDWQNGVCNYCHTTDANYMTAAEDGFYEIGALDQLLWFAAMVNSGTQPDIKGRLTAAIDMSGAEWPSIGNASAPYTGTFDGQHFAIDNLPAPLFGTVRGATLKRIAIESGSITGRNTALGSQTGSIVCVATTSELTDSYSKATIVIGDEGDLGGLVGKFTGTIRDCGFFGSLSSAAWSQGGIAGSGESGAITIEDCIVIAELITTGGDAKGTILGWNDAATISNCYTIEAPTGFRGFSGNTDDAGTNNQMLAVDAFFHGDVAWNLNNGSFVDPSWFQNLGEDDYPLPNSAHNVVYALPDGSYTNDMEQMKEAVVTEAEEYAENVVAQQTLKDAFTATISGVESATTSAELSEAYAIMLEARNIVDASAKAYAAYTAKIEEIRAYVDENADGMAGPSLEKLEEYIGDNVAPEDGDFPNGSYEYIVTALLLDAEALVAEAEYAQSLLDEAIRNGYAPGTEITTLIRNANLDAEPNFDGWTYTMQGSKLTVLRDEEHTYTAEIWNGAFDMYQTLTGLTNGVYEVRLNAAFRAANNEYDGNDNYAAFLYANDNTVNIMTAGEDLISVEDAVHMENSYFEAASYPDNLYDNGIVAGYYPVGPAGCYYAFGAGRYENRIVAVVTDGTLTIGVKNAGTGCANDWVGFDNFRLFYLGNTEQAAEGITPTLEGMVNRANTLLAYEADGGEFFRQRPNFSNALRTQLEEAVLLTETAESTEDKMALVATFSGIFNEIYTCKQAYVALEATIESLITQVFEDPTATPEEQTDLQQKAAISMEKWLNGDYSTEQALVKEDLMQSLYCQRYLQGAPAQIAGVWQLATLEDMMWFSRFVNEMGDIEALATIVAPIDMSGIAWESIGKVARPYAGKFDGGLNPITNLTTPLFGTVDGAEIKGIAVVGGTFGGNADYAAHTGSIIGHSQGRTFLTQSYSTAHMRTSVGDCGGLIGKVSGTGTIKDCFFAGNLTTGWTAGCLVGSSDGSTTIAEVSDCYVDATNVTYKNGDAHGLVVGWLHDGLTSAFSNVYVIAGAELTNIMGYTDNAAAAGEACKTLTAEEFASGAVAHNLNHGNETNPVWFQNLGSDATPVLYDSHMIVILNEDGTYSNKQGDAIDKVEIGQKFPANVNVYDMQGRLVRANVKGKDSLNGLPKGLYIVGGAKVLHNK